MISIEDWNMTRPDSGSPETEIIYLAYAYKNGDWHAAIKATVLALGNNLPVPDWARSEAASELRRAIEFEPVPKKRKRGRHTRSGKVWDQTRQQYYVAAVDAAENLEFRGKAKFDLARKVLNATECPVGEDSLKTLYKRHSAEAHRDINFEGLVEIFEDLEREILESRIG